MSKKKPKTYAEVFDDLKKRGLTMTEYQMMEEEKKKYLRFINLEKNVRDLENRVNKLESWLKSIRKAPTD